MLTGASYQSYKNEWATESPLDGIIIAYILRPITLCVNDVNKQQYESVNNARDTMWAFTRKNLWAGDIYDYAAI